MSRLLPMIMVTALLGLAACAMNAPAPPAVPRLSESGTLLGALLRSEAGTSMRESDVVFARRAAEQAHGSRVGVSVEWSNPETGNAGSVTPVREGYAQNGAFCREYQQIIRAGGRREQVFGIACRQPDGAWRLTSS